MLMIVSPDFEVVKVKLMFHSGREVYPDRLSEVKVYREDLPGRQKQTLMNLNIS
jgi:hypothetical protein